MRRSRHLTRLKKLEGKAPPPYAANPPNSGIETACRIIYRKYEQKREDAQPAWPLEEVRRWARDKERAKGGELKEEDRAWLAWVDERERLGIVQHTAPSSNTSKTTYRQKY